MKIDQNTGKLILYAVAGFLTYKIVYSILSKIGAIETKEDKIADEFIASPFLTKEPFLEWMRANKKDGIPFINYVDNPAVRALFAGSAGKIYDAKNFFNDDEEKVYSAFRALPSKIHVSAVAYYFNYLYSRSLPDFLKGFMSNEELSEINKIVNSKPSQFSLNIK